jgi:hypothetical protein
LSFTRNFAFGGQKTKTKIIDLFMIEIESALICFFYATELKIAPKFLKMFVFTEKIILKHFLWFLNFVKNLGSK